MLGALLALWGCGDAPASEAPEAVPRAVALETLAPQRIVPRLSVPGLVEAESRISLAFRVSGFVARFAVDEGDAVEAGQLLAELSPEDFERDLRGARAALARARAEARDAKLTFERQERLREGGSTSQQAHDRARSAHDVARAALVETRTALEHAEDRLAKATLRAPLSGTIEERLVEPHEPAAAEQPVLVLTRLDTVKVRASVADTFAAGLVRGGPAWVTTPLDGGRRLEGRIARVGVAADAATRTVPFEVELDNRERALLPELAVEVEVATGAERDLLLVPLSAVLRDADTRPFCFVAASGGAAGEGLRAERRRVATGDVHGERIAVTGGLAAGERLVVRGQHFLRDGDLLVEAEAR